ncbi:MAG: DUF167 family protein [Candidatus Anstonellaceae archaeon]
MPTVFTVRVSANRGSFSASLASENPLVMKADVPSEPRKGKANKVLLFELERLLGCRVELLSGQTGRKKTLAADCTREELIDKVRNQRKM